VWQQIAEFSTSMKAANRRIAENVHA
jgi:hypothetical protein